MSSKELDALITLHQPRGLQQGGSQCPVWMALAMQGFFEVSA